MLDELKKYAETETAHRDNTDGQGGDERKREGDESEDDERTREGAANKPKTYYSPGVVR